MIEPLACLILYHQCLDCGIRQAITTDAVYRMICGLPAKLHTWQPATIKHKRGPLMHLRVPPCMVCVLIVRLLVATLENKHDGYTQLIWLEWNAIGCFRLSLGLLPHHHTVKYVQSGPGTEHFFIQLNYAKFWTSLTLKVSYPYLHPLQSRIFFYNNFACVHKIAK